MPRIREDWFEAEQLIRAAQEGNLPEVRTLMPASETQRRELVDIAAGSPWFMAALRAVRDLHLTSWCIGAGAVRNLVWDALHGYQTRSALADIALTVIAPHGLDDLLSIVVRRNPARVSVETYRQRVVHKRYAERWPKVSVVPC
jgi:hypothetical protein